MAVVDGAVPNQKDYREKVIAALIKNAWALAPHQSGLWRSALTIHDGTRAVSLFVRAEILYGPRGRACRKMFLGRRFLDRAVVSKEDYSLIGNPQTPAIRQRNPSLTPELMAIVFRSWPIITPTRQLQLNA